MRDGQVPGGGQKLLLSSPALLSDLVTYLQEAGAGPSKGPVLCEQPSLMGLQAEVSTRGPSRSLPASFRANRLCHSSANGQIPVPSRP